MHAIVQHDHRLRASLKAEAELLLGSALGGGDVHLNRIVRLIAQQSIHGVRHDGADASTPQIPRRDKVAVVKSRSPLRARTQDTSRQFSGGLGMLPRLHGVQRIQGGPRLDPQQGHPTHGQGSYDQRGSQDGDVAVTTPRRGISRQPACGIWDQRRMSNGSIRVHWIESPQLSPRVARSGALGPSLA